jgi:hypothetical protein
MGDAQFQGVYSLIALLTFSLMIVAYRKVPLTANYGQWETGSGRL